MGKFSPTFGQIGIARTSLFAVCGVGALAVAGVASAQTVWETPSMPAAKDGSWVTSAGTGVGQATQKGMEVAGKAGADVSRSTAYGVSHPSEVMSKSAKASSITYDETRSGFMEAAESPLRDFNMMQRAIPAVLIAAEKNPYDAHGLASCKAIGDQVSSLDLALGPDVDTPNIEKVRDSYARSATFVANSALDAIRDVTTHVIPARNVIRRATGADKYDRDVKNAVLAGAVRRGFLKAYGMMHDCDWPAAPIGFQPVRGGDWTPESSVQTTKLQTIASNSGAMVVTVSTVSSPVDGSAADPSFVTRTQTLPARRELAPASAFAPAPAQAGAWPIGRASPVSR